ncbi:MAG: hypothetical protein CMN78_02375 [Spirochaetales bacterium]|nr:hypothetical protein [Spirochaetales bacterium]
MKKLTHDLGALEWKVRGYYPYEWRLGRTVEIGTMLQGDVPSIPATVPGSVQNALRTAVVIPDWEVGLNAKPCEWVVTEKYRGSCGVFPCSMDNPLWRRSSWWIEWDQFINEQGREPRNALEYVTWGQKRHSGGRPFSERRSNR